MTVGELAPGGHDVMADYTRGSDRLHTAYAFDFLGPWPGVERLADILSRWGEGSDDGWPSWAFSNHDVTRVATRWGDAIGATPEQAAELFMALLLSLRGTIFIYQGEELGLPEADVPFEMLQDPWGIAGWPATKGRDGCRTPMPWDSSPAAGFSIAEPWLPIDVAHRDLSVALSPPTLTSARMLIALRNASPALAVGSFTVVHAEGDVLAFERSADGERILCACNLSSGPNSVTASGKMLWSSEATLADGRIELAPYGAAWVAL